MISTSSCFFSLVFFYLRVVLVGFVRLSLHRFSCFLPRWMLPAMTWMCLLPLLHRLRLRLTLRIVPILFLCGSRSMFVFLNCFFFNFSKENLNLGAGSQKYAAFRSYDERQ